MWDLRKLKELRNSSGPILPEEICMETFNVHENAVFCFERHKNLFFSGSKDKRVVVFDIEHEWKVFQVIDAHSSWVWSISASSSRTFYTTSADNTVKVWKRKKKKPSHKFALKLTLSGHSDQVFCIAAINKQRLVTGSYDKTVRLWKKKRKDQVK